MKCSVEVKKVEGNEKVKAYAQIVIDECFVIKNIRILEGKKGLFIAMPSYKTKKVDKDGNAIWQNYAYPVTKNARAQIDELILRAYESGKEESVGVAAELAFKAEIYTNTNKESNCEALVTCVLGNYMAIRGIKVLRGKEGCFVAMPTVSSGKVDENGRPIYREVAHPITKEFRSRLCDTILKGAMS